MCDVVPNIRRFTLDVYEIGSIKFLGCKNGCLTKNAIKIVINLFTSN